MSRADFAPTRRGLLAAGAGFAAVVAVRPAWATPEEMQAALRGFTGGAAVKRGRIKLDVPPLVENGNTVPLTVTVDSPMTEREHVKAIAVFNERNPQPNVAVFHLGPRAGRAAVSTRMRLATSQTVTAVAALSDGSYWSDAIEVVVTLAACVEG
ncbi:MAG: SoxY-related AACIE arm protein [Rhodospirillales bacterium]